MTPELLAELAEALNGKDVGLYLRREALDLWRIEVMVSPGLGIAHRTSSDCCGELVLACLGWLSARCVKVSISLTTQWRVGVRLSPDSPVVNTFSPDISVAVVKATIAALMAHGGSK